MTKQHDERIGELMRNGTVIYYAILGRDMVESRNRQEVVATLNKYAPKLAEWDKRR